MSFTYPWMLFLLVIPAVLLGWIWRHEQGRIALPFDYGRQSRGGWLRFFVNCAECLPALVLSVAIVILAGPQQLSEPKSKRALTNIEFCVDISGSMTAPFGAGSRYDGSMEAINKFLEYRSGDAFGLTFFGNSVLHWVPLTQDVSAFRCAPPFMRPEVAPPWFGGTEIGKALMACRKILVEREVGDRMIVLISDGFSSDLSGGRDEEIAARMNADNIVVYAVHIADSAAPDAVVNITRNTGGEVFQPDDPETLDIVFKRIDEMQETRLEKTAAESMDNFIPFCVCGLAVLGLSSLSLFGLRYTPW